MCAVVQDLGADGIGGSCGQEVKPYVILPVIRARKACDQQRCVDCAHLDPLSAAILLTEPPLSAARLQAFTAENQPHFIPLRSNNCPFHKELFYTLSVIM